MMKLPLLITFLATTLTNVHSSDLKLLLLHNNDMHARFEETSKSSGTCKPKDRNVNCYGGMARTAHLIREARKAAADGTGPNVLYLNAGDTYTGTAWFSVHKYKIVADFLNLLAPDAMSFGNHEFDLGVDAVVPLIDAAKFPIVAANLDFRDEPSLANSNVTKSVTLIQDGHKIGIIGYLTPETKIIATTEDVIFLDEVDAIKTESERLDNEGVKIIIALGHSGFETDKRIAANVPLVDVVIGGHSNTFLYNGPQPDLEVIEGLYPTVITQSNGKKVPVVQAYAYTKYLGRLLTTFNEKGDLIQFSGNPLLVTSDIEQDQDVLDLLDKYRPEIEALEMQIVGRTKVMLDASNCRKKECNFGNFITDAMVNYGSMFYAGNHWTDAPIGIHNGGAIRKSIDVGNVTRGDLLGSLPFDSQIIKFSLNGTDLLKTLETSVRSNGETSYGEFLQFSGLKVIYDLTKPAWHRVVEVSVRCGDCTVPQYEPLDLQKTYRLVGTSFLIKGGDGYEVLRQKSFDKVTEDLNDLEMLVGYLGKRSPIYPEENGRISFAKNDMDISEMSKSHVARYSTCLMSISVIIHFILLT